MKVTPQEHQIRLHWPLDMKIEYFCKKVSEFVIYFKGECFATFSGGKDSKVGIDIIDKIWDGTYKHITPNWERLVSYQKPRKLFSNTGLEFPEIVQYVKSHSDVDFVKPKMSYIRVIEQYGYAVISKNIAGMIRRTKSYILNPSSKNEATKNLYLTGIKKDGSKASSTSKIPNKWMKLLNAPFDVSDKCCDVLKKEPFERYATETGKVPIVFTTTSESDRRTTSYYTTGCNSFEEGKERCRPLSIFTEVDVWEYAKRWNIRFAEVYYERTIPVEQVDGSIKITTIAAEKQTGCMWCMFGIHLEDKTQNNRIQRIAISHPKMHDIIVNRLGLAQVLSFIGVSYKPLKAKIACGKQTAMFE